ncbi:hypothetical protein ATEIFO6365_0008049700 [Aspergillus terreus]|uniref:Uncharacterized protein n=1 Tax=Aspergillus terreus TaxID=33178 RepID=A0A5M3Z6R8_ASPTE|nr:hypothetical protein ATETN484_0010050600 [Aspergillus terreus]GFF18553.1 hypothetical protein ATEIFO6365_0008049700 [Aspergillus terreus]
MHPPTSSLRGHSHLHPPNPEKKPSNRSGTQPRVRANGSDTHSDAIHGTIGGVYRYGLNRLASPTTMDLWRGEECGSDESCYTGGLRGKYTPYTIGLGPDTRPYWMEVGAAVEAALRISLRSRTEIADALDIGNIGMGG